MTESIYLEIEENDNCSYMPMQIYESRANPVPVKWIRLFEPDRPHGVYEVTGWDSRDGGVSCPAMYAPISDSGQAEVHLIYGGDWGVRIRPSASKEEWDVKSMDQWGEPYLVLTDKEDVLMGLK